MMIGIMFSTLPVFTIVSKPLLGSIADKFQQKKSVFLISMLISYGAIFSSYFIPLNLKDFQSTLLTCHGGFVLTFPCPSSASLTSNVPYADSLQQDSQPLACNFICQVSYDVVANLCSNSPFLCSSSGNDTVSLNMNASFYFSEIQTLVPQRNVTEFSDMKDECQLQPLSSSTPSLDVADPTSGCDNVTLLPCEIHCDTTNVSDVHNSSSRKIFKEDDDDIFRVTSQMAFLWLCMSLIYFGYSATVSIGDTLVIEMLNNSGYFGRQRLWGSVGWGIVSVLVGYLVDVVSADKSYKDYTPGYCVILVCAILHLPLAVGIKVDNCEKPKHLLRNVGHLFLKPHVATFTFSVFLIGCLTGAVWTFLIIYLNELHATQLLIGLAMAVEGVLGEIPFLFFSNWFLKKLSHDNTMILVLAAFGLRLLAYSLISNPWTVLPVELMQGITYGLFYAALATYPNQIAPPNLQATLQGILQGTFEGVGK